MDENQKKAFDFSADLTKQIITLSTGIFTLTVTFSKDIIGSVESSNRYLLLISWILFIISILFGISTLMALTGNLDPMTKNNEDDKESENKPKIYTITSSNVTSTAKLQVLTFIAALILTCWYGFSALSGNETIKSDPSTLDTIKCNNCPQINIENNPTFNNNCPEVKPQSQTTSTTTSKTKWCKCSENDTINTKR